MVLVVESEVIRQSSDTLGKQGDLYMGGSCIAGTLSVPTNDLLLHLSPEHMRCRSVLLASLLQALYTNTTEGTDA